MKTFFDKVSMRLESYEDQGKGLAVSPGENCEERPEGVAENQLRVSEAAGSEEVRYGQEAAHGN